MNLPDEIVIDIIHGQPEHLQRQFRKGHPAGMEEFLLGRPGRLPVADAGADLITKAQQKQQMIWNPLAEQLQNRKADRLLSKQPRTPATP